MNIFRILKTSHDQQILWDLGKLMEWTDKWLLFFHSDECKHMHKTRNSQALLERTYNFVPNQKLEAMDNEKDIGV